MTIKVYQDVCVNFPNIWSYNAVKEGNTLSVKPLGGSVCQKFMFTYFNSSNRVETNLPKPK